MNEEVERKNRFFGKKIFLLKRQSCLLKRQTSFADKQGFTLIELLMVIAIIVLLVSAVLVSQSVSRNKATASATKTTLSSLKSVLGQCCSNLDNTINSVPIGPGGGSICSAGMVTSTYPTITDLKMPDGQVAYAVAGNCNDSNPAINVIITGHPLAACNASWRLEVFGRIIPPDGC